MIKLEKNTEEKKSLMWRKDGIGGRPHKAEMKLVEKVGKRRVESKLQRRVVYK